MATTRPVHLQGISHGCVATHLIAVAVPDVARLLQLPLGFHPPNFPLLAGALTSNKPQAFLANRDMPSSDPHAPIGPNTPSNHRIEAACQHPAPANNTPNPSPQR